MIKNAKEAREIYQYFKKLGLNHDQIMASSDGWKYFESQGYLAALNGPEVKALAAALEDLNEEIPGGRQYATRALDKYRDAAEARAEAFREVAKHLELLRFNGVKLDVDEMAQQILEAKAVGPKDPPKKGDK